MLRELDLLAATLGVPHAPDLNRLLGIPALWKVSGAIENPELIRSQGVTVATGQFQAHMQVELVNDGPVTLSIDSRTPE